MPPFMWTTEGEEAFHPGGSSPFKRLKAFFAPIYRLYPNDTSLPVIDVGLRPAYQFGGDDLISLARGIMQLVETVGGEVEDALYDEKGIHFMTPNETDLADLPTVQAIIPRLAAMTLPEHDHRPRAMGIRPQYGEPSQYLMLLMVEALHWLHLEPDHTDYIIPRSSLEMGVSKLETVSMCVNAVSMLHRYHPRWLRYLPLGSSAPSADPTLASHKSATSSNSTPACIPPSPPMHRESTRSSPSSAPSTCSRAGSLLSGTMSSSSCA